MGFNSTIVIAQVAGASATGERNAYPDITIEMPRWGWEWARDRHSLASGTQRYRLMTDDTPGGTVEDAYGTPLQALDPQALLTYIKNEHHDSYRLPAVAALRAALKRLVKGKWAGEYVVLCIGH